MAGRRHRETGESPREGSEDGGWTEREGIC
jgi:hypothetical protein